MTSIYTIKLIQTNQTLFSLHSNVIYQKQMKKTTAKLFRSVKHFCCCLLHLMNKCSFEMNFQRAIHWQRMKVFLFESRLKAIFYPPHHWRSSEKLVQVHHRNLECNRPKKMKRFGYEWCIHELPLGGLTTKNITQKILHSFLVNSKTFLWSFCFKKVYILLWESIFCIKKVYFVYQMYTLCFECTLCVSNTNLQRLSERCMVLFDFQQYFWQNMKYFQYHLLLFFPR